VKLNGENIAGSTLSTNRVASGTLERAIRIHKKSGDIWMVTRRSFIALNAALASASLLGALPAKATPRNIMVLGKSIDGIVNGFDPAEAYDASSDVLPNMYRTLVMYDGTKKSKLAGDLAESWDISNGGLVYRFKLKSDAKFESGAPVTAADVAYSLQRVIKLNKSPSFLLTQLGLNANNIDAAARATGPNVVTLTLPEVRATGLVLATLSTTVSGIVERKTVMENESNGDMGNIWLRKHSAGAGSFRLVDWQAGDHIILEANPNASVQPKTKRLAIRHMAEPATESLLLKKGDLDIARTLGSDELRSLAGDKSLSIIPTDSLVLIYVQMNMAHPMFQKPEVLQAIKWSIDYDAIATNVTPGLWNSWQSFLPQGTPGAISERPFRKDVAKAKMLLAKAGYPNGFEVTFDHPNTWPFPDIAQAMQADLAQVGIRLKLLAGDYAQVLAKRRARQHQMQIGRFGADHIDSSAFASYFLPNTDDSDATKIKNGAWNNHFVNPALTTASNAANRELDSDKRLAMYQQMQREFWDVAPMIFLLQKRDVVVTRSNVTGLAMGPIDAYTRYAGVQKT
jgi:peptide/nickel transport system substrate-binding protein